jgi:hypothetical protein
MASPRVTIRTLSTSALFSVMRWATKRQLLLNSTMSPGFTLAAVAGSTTRVSPGQIVGTMLRPVACRVKLPEQRSTSAATSRVRACTSLGNCDEELMMRWNDRCNCSALNLSFRTKAPWSQTPAHTGTPVFHTVSFPAAHPLIETHDLFP